MMINRWLSGVILLSLLPFLFSHAAFAADAGKPSDVRIIVDISGSMKDSDPQNLRIPAVNLLVELLPDNAQAGVWTFGHYVNMLVPLGLVDKSWREKARSEAQNINSVGLYTNLAGVLEKASWKIAADSGFNQTVILLTDGKIDMPADSAGQVNQKEHDRLFNAILPAYAAAGARIHTVALSDAADKKLLKQIALETGGMFLEAQDADSLLKAFLKAFDRAVPVEQVPMTDNQFEIDASVKEFTALVFRKAGSKATSLVTPSGAVLSAENSAQQDNVRWHQDVNFDLITVSSPEAGSWKADAETDPDNRVQILSDLTLSVDGVPASIFSGSPLELATALKNDGKVVDEQAILSLTDFTLKVTAPDGRSGSKLLSDPEHLPADGVFRESMKRLSQIGEYQFEVTAVGRTFQRRQVLTSTLLEPLRVSVDDITDEERVHISVIAEGDNIDTTLSRVIARVTSPDGSSLINTMAFDATTNAWEMDLRADKGPGRYNVELNIRGVTATGTTFRSKPDDIVRDFPLVVPEEGTPPDVSTVASQPEVMAPAQPTPAAAEPVAQPEPAKEAAPEQTPPAPDTVVPDLAKRFAEQAATEEVPEVKDEAGLAWWIYLLLALGNLAIFGGAGAWWYMKKRKAPAPAEAVAVASAEDLSPSAPVEGLSEEDFNGDFDAFSDTEEEEIPMPEDKPVKSPSSMGSDTNISVSLDDDFAIDAEPDSENLPDDEWGEFDTDDKK